GGWSGGRGEDEARGERAHRLQNAARVLVGEDADHEGDGAAREISPQRRVERVGARRIVRAVEDREGIAPEDLEGPGPARAAEPLTDRRLVRPQLAGGRRREQGVAGLVDAEQAAG